MVQLHQRRVADQLGDIIGNFHRIVSLLDFYPKRNSAAVMSGDADD
jgi:hypothetical protein